MTPSATVASAASPAVSSERAASGWLAWVALVSTSSILTGVYWDISWHMSIGRDTFWTPAHLAIQLGGILLGLSSAAVIFSTTFGRNAEAKAAGIGVWGFRGPLGAFVCAWGCIAMATSVPFDDWWHNAYGLDVKILSPPHMVLNFGILGVCGGGQLLVLSTMNRAAPAQRRTFERMFLFIASELLVLGLIAVWENTYRVDLHLGTAYRSVCAIVPGLLLGVSRTIDRRWVATRLAATYSGLLLLGLWVMPLFSAEPKLGPVYQPITHFVPLEFPLLVIVPAFFFDLLRPWLEGKRLWLQALVLGPVFFTTFIAVQWPFAEFLVSPASANHFFGTGAVPYFVTPLAPVVRHEFVAEPAGTTALNLGIAAFDAIWTSAVGLFAAAASRKVRR